MADVSDTADAKTVVSKAVRSGRWWRWPRNVIVAFYAIAGFGALHGTSSIAPSVGTTKPGIAAPLPKITTAEPTVAEQKSQRPAPTAAKPKHQKFSDTPWGTRIFEQRECQGIEDCTEANIEREQTEASRMLNRISRTSLRRAIELLGQPNYVLRAGDKVPVEYYENNVAERGFAQAVIMWVNGSCAANSIHVTSVGGRPMATPDAGGAECTIDGRPFPMPTDAFNCAKGRKSDPLCKLENVLKLPGM